MNDAATATAIFPFRQPQERESTIRSRARSGPATTPPRHQVPSSPEGEHASDDRHRGAKQPASADRGKPDRFTSDHERGASTGRNSEKRNKLPSNGIDTSKPPGLSPPGEPSQGLETPEPQRSTADQIGTSPRVRGSAHQLTLRPGGRSPHTRGVNTTKRSTADQQRTPSNTRATGDRPLFARHDLRPSNTPATGDTPEPTTTQQPLEPDQQDPSPFTRTRQSNPQHRSRRDHRSTRQHRATRRSTRSVILHPNPMIRPSTPPEA